MGEKVKLSDAIKQLSAAVTDTLHFFETLDYNDMSKLLKAFQQLHEAKEALKDQTSYITDLYEKLSYEKIPDIFEAHQFDSVKSGGRNFIVSVRIDASIPQEQKAAGFAWIKDVAKTPELIVPSVNPRSLSSFVKGYYEAHGEWPPEEAIKVHKKRYISIRKA